MEVSKPTSLPVRKIDPAKVQIHYDNKKKVCLKYQDKPFIIQTPYLKVKSIEGTNLDDILKLTVLLDGSQPKKIIEFASMIESLEDHLGSLVSREGVNWFESNDVVIKALIRNDGDNVYYMSLPLDTSRVTVIDEDRASCDPQDFSPTDEVKLMINFEYIWLGKNMFGLGAIIKKILVKHEAVKKQPVIDYDFEDSSESDDEPDGIYSLLSTERSATVRQINGKSGVYNARVANHTETSANVRQQKKANYAASPDYSMSSRDQTSRRPHPSLLDDKIIDVDDTSPIRDITIKMNTENIDELLNGSGSDTDSYLSDDS
jgi:hypothetical protein